MDTERKSRHERRRHSNRSSSPYRRKPEEGGDRHHSHKRRRSRERGSNRHKEKAAKPKALPYDARELIQRDLKIFRPMFALYLDIQKNIDISVLDDKEVKGRWKSFINKWNRGEVAEGWYDPATLQKSLDDAKQILPHMRDSPDYGAKDVQANENQHSSGDEYGPSLASSTRQGRGKSGPTIPNMQDLALKRERAAEDAAEDAVEARDALRAERKAYRKADKERLEELAPRAEAGTRERQLEKRKELASSNRSFAAAKEGGDMAEMRDTDLMGGDDSVADLKRRGKEMERQKNERELRREEILRAKREEREERAREFREKEERTMAELKELARQRFG